MDLSKRHFLTKQTLAARNGRVPDWTSAGFTRELGLTEDKPSSSASAAAAVSPAASPAASPAVSLAIAVSAEPGFLSVSEHYAPVADAEPSPPSSPSARDLAERRKRAESARATREEKRKQQAAAQQQQQVMRVSIQASPLSSPGSGSDFSAFRQGLSSGSSGASSLGSLGARLAAAGLDHDDNESF